MFFDENKEEKIDSWQNWNKQNQNPNEVDYDFEKNIIAKYK